MEHVFSIFISFAETYPYLIAPILGTIPALIWLWFWLSEDTHPESPRMITLAFLGGMIAVILVLPLQEYIYNRWLDHPTFSFIAWATLEEIFKFMTVYWIALRKKQVVDEPIDDVIYLIVAALGFVSMENTLFVFTPLHSGNLIDTIITGNLRFVGASLVHVVSSATIGISMAFSFYQGRISRAYHIVGGIILAILLHTLFNLSIIDASNRKVMIIFFTVWVAIVLILALIEKIKSITKPDPRKLNTL